MKNCESGYGGIANLGNTCFLSACVQILAHTPFLDVAFHRLGAPHPKIIPNDFKSAAMAATAVELVNEFWALREKVLAATSGTVVIPSAFLLSIQKCARENGVANAFAAFSQNDVVELIQFIVEQLQKCFPPPSTTPPTPPTTPSQLDATNKVATAIATFEDTKKRGGAGGGAEIIKELFFGVSYTCISNLHDDANDDNKNILSVHPQEFFVLDMAVSANCSLEECFMRMVDVELLDGDCKWFNDNTKQYESVLRQTRFWRLPPILILSLQRYDHGTEAAAVVQFPMTFTLTSENNEESVYSLYAVCNHHGDARQGGHYNSFVRNLHTGEWMFCDDANVRSLGVGRSGGSSTVSVATYDNEQSHTAIPLLLDHMATAQVYCLFYACSTRGANL